MKQWLALAAWAARNLLRRRARFALTAMAFLLTTTLLGAYILLRDALVAESERVTSAMPDLVVSRLVAGRPATLELADADALRGIASVGTVTPRVWGYVFSSALQGNMVVVADDGGTRLDRALAAGRDLEADGEMVLGGTLADALGLRVGDRLAMPTPYGTSSALLVVGILDARNDTLAADVLLTRPHDARSLLGLGPQQVVDLAVSVRNPAERPVVGSAITARIPGARVIDKTALQRLYAVGYGWKSGFAAVCTLPALLALLLLAAERSGALDARERREIALCKAVGFSTREVLLGKLLEALMVSSVGTAAGLLCAHVWVFSCDAVGLRHALFGFSVLSPNLLLSPATSAAALVAISLTIVAPYAALGAVSAWKVAVDDPVTALRAS